MIIPNDIYWQIFARWVEVASRLFLNVLDVGYCQVFLAVGLVPSILRRRVDAGDVQSLARLLFNWMLTTNTIATTTAAADDYVLNILVFLVRIHFLAKTFLGHISVNVCAHTHTHVLVFVSPSLVSPSFRGVNHFNGSLQIPSKTLISVVNPHKSSWIILDHKLAMASIAISSTVTRGCPFLLSPVTGFFSAMPWPWPTPPQCWRMRSGLPFTAPSEREGERIVTGALPWSVCQIFWDIFSISHLYIHEAWAWLWPLKPS